MRNTRRENLSEHSLETAQIAHALALIGNKRLSKSYNANFAAVAAMYHDTPEIITGDMPTPIKYDNPTIQSAYKEVEAVAEQKLLNMLPEDLRPAYDEALTIPDPQVRALVKAADKLSAYIKCVEELKAGNNEFRQAAGQTRKALEGYELPEVTYFLETFMDSFSLTLDELQ